MSTGHRGWAIAALGDLLLRNLSTFRTKKVEIPQSRRHIRSLSGFLYLPKADLHFFMQQDLLVECFDRGWIRNDTPFIVRYTHNNKAMSNYREVLRRALLITVENSQLKKEMVSLGIKEEKVQFLPHPIKWELFNAVRNLNRSRDVIFVSNFYRRKRPDIIVDLIIANPSITFTLYGKNWELFPRFPELLKQPNFNYRIFKYSEYAQVLAKHRIFCSVSDVEGGPVPLLESLTTGLIPVVTDTGYARDVIPNEFQHYIVPVSPDIKLLSQKLSSALNDKMLDLDTSVYSEDRFVQQINKLIYSCKV